MKFLEKDKLENKLTKKVKSIGILGGTFDPAHLGHVKLSSTARKKFKIDEIISVSYTHLTLPTTPYV